ncbi:MAG TPA: hypothetical protein DEP32_12885 [Pseudomonas sp.]|nr:hypothetical protein [Pseudomonas sp.]MBB51296.1 hypothetical protein [Pseudomonadales bacterium]MBF77169.1 hypothetical protein [Pseudomonadales bacterium]MBU31993.1 hypothetical protein [Pseudomonadales bacterium]HCA25052.1 hypothetical protein [Pseudomonas sp.]|tara:strand:+ start:1959 stop:2732 length:774 start_codon:yes stop_codon:yes gene_type:complete
MSQGNVEIYDLMACNVYMDFENTGLPKEQHKFLIAFHPTGGDPVHELIDSITCRGPDGYVVEVANQPYTITNLNGHIFDRTTHSHWYMINLYTGFMAPGEYSIEVKCKNGETKRISRVQDNAPSERLMAGYLKHRDRLKASYRPGHEQKLPAGTPLTNLAVDCESFKTLTGEDAWYVFRICEARNSKEFDPQNLYWWDNIFLQRLSDPDAGKNRNHLVISAELRPGTAYTYFCELTDGNTMGGTNICIFQPYQTFYT